MKRVVLLALLVTLSAASATSATTHRTAQSDGVASGGIGLARDAWEAVHGPGEAGQTLVTYAGTYETGFRDGVVSFVEFGWDDPGVSFPEAEDAVRGLLPTDARLVEAFAAPATAGGPVALLMHRYDSPSLTALVPEFGGAWTGGILVVYQEVPVPGSMERNVGRVSLVGGEAP
ncbi:MAG: hypothetical protein M3Q10_04750 [Chloroflexota bacterium]|nr:hypothetical protein [Chloroflexota bacterium]